MRPLRFGVSKPPGEDRNQFVRKSTGLRGECDFSVIFYGKRSVFPEPFLNAPFGSIRFYDRNKNRLKNRVYVGSVIERNYTVVRRRSSRPRSLSSWRKIPFHFSRFLPSSGFVGGKCTRLFSNGPTK